VAAGGKAESAPKLLVVAGEEGKAIVGDEREHIRSW